MSKNERPEVGETKPLAGCVMGCHMILTFNPKHVHTGASNVFVQEVIDAVNTVVNKDDAYLDWIVTMLGRNLL